MMDRSGRCVRIVFTCHFSWRLDLSDSFLYEDFKFELAVVYCDGSSGVGPASQYHFRDEYNSHSVTYGLSGGGTWGES